MSTDTQAPATDTTNAAATTEVTTPAAVTPSPATEVKPQTQDPVIPEKYELKLEEGSKLDPSYVEKFSAFAKEKKMTQEQAQEFLAREHTAVQSYYDQQLQNFEKTKEAWKQQTISDPEIGGEKFNENVELAHRALKQFGSENFIKEIDATGYGNHPELVRVFARIGKMMSESKMVIPGTQSGGTREMSDVFYGGNKQN